LVWSWEDAMITRTSRAPPLWEQQLRAGDTDLHGCSYLKGLGQMSVAYIFFMPQFGCETCERLMRVGTKSEFPERREQKIHHGHQRTCPGRKHLSAMLQHLLRALPCVEQRSRLAFLSNLKKSWAELMRFSQLWS